TALRGAITDRNGIDLAVSEPARDLAADPYLITDALGSAQRLAPLLGQSQASVLRKLSEHSGFVYLARGVPASRAAEILALKVPGVTGTPVMRRVYPRGPLAAQVLGGGGTEGRGVARLEEARGATLRWPPAAGRSWRWPTGHRSTPTILAPRRRGRSRIARSASTTNPAPRSRRGRA